MPQGGMHLTDDRGRSWTCAERPLPAGLVFRAVGADEPSVVKVLDPPGDPAEERRLSRLARAAPRISPTVLAAGTIPDGQHLGGRRFVVLPVEGHSLDDWGAPWHEHAPDRRQLLAENLGGLGLDLLHAIRAARSVGLEPLQLDAEHVLLRNPGDRPVLCGWSGAWDPDAEHSGRATPWPEPHPVPEATAIYLWGLLMAQAALERPALPVRTADGLYRALRDEDWEDLEASALGGLAAQNRARADVLRRAMDLNPGRRPTVADAVERWTAAGDVEGAGGTGATPLQWRQQVGAFVIRYPAARYAAMAAATFAGFVAGQALMALTPLG